MSERSYKRSYISLPWLKREIAQWVHPTKDRSDDPSHHELTALTTELHLAPLAETRNSSMGPPHEGSIRQPIAPRSYISLPSLVKTRSLLSVLCVLSFQDCKHCNYKNANNKRWTNQLIILATERAISGIFNFLVPLRSNYININALQPIVLLLEQR